MSAPYEGSNTHATQIETIWPALTATAETGGSAITSYGLEYTLDPTGTLDTWHELIGETTPSTVLSYIHTGVTPGSSYYYRVKANNVFGWGPYSTTLTVVPSQVPDTMSAVTTAVDGTNVKISWSAPASNGAAITKYKIMILQSDGLTYTESSSSCDGSDPTIMSQLYCLVSIKDILRASPYSLAYGTLVIAKVQAYNTKGWSSLSPANVAGATIETEPTAMSAPSNGASTSASQIEVTWSAISSSPANGGSTITSYNLQWDKGTAGTTWYDVVGYSPAYTGTSYILTTSITKGTIYQFKVRASNVFGWGAFSSTTSIKASQIPASLTTSATTSIDSTTGGVMISWTAPDNGGETLTSYAVEIADTTTSTWTADTTNCDGSNASVMSNLYCIIPMSTLTSSPYSLTFDQLVQVRVRATNSKGPATSYSPINTSGAKIRSVPD